MIEALIKLSEGNSRFKGISPSALNTYIECRFRFYLRHVAKIKEPDEVEEDLDARVLGNFLHEVMEHFYRQLQDRKNSNLVVAADFNNGEAIIDRLIDEVFIEAYHLDPGKTGSIRRTTIGGKGNRKTICTSDSRNGQSLCTIRNRSIGTRWVGAIRSLSINIQDQRCSEEKLTGLTEKVI